jgi:hypothetical protein
MILLVAPSRQAVPYVPVESTFRRLILPRRRSKAEARLKAELDSGGYALLLSVGFAAAADRTLRPGDLLLATRVFGSADVYSDLPPFQAPGAVRGSLCTLPDERERAAREASRRYPPAYAFDNHAFWLVQAARAAGVPCLVLRAILLELGKEAHQPPPLFQDVISGHFGQAMLRRPAMWRELGSLLRNAARCRDQLASALAILLVLHGRMTPAR